MAIRVGVQPLIYGDNSISKADFNNIVTEAFLSSYACYEMTYEDYVGIYHQIMAIELGYTK